MKSLKSQDNFLSDVHGTTNHKAFQMLKVDNMIIEILLSFKTISTPVNTDGSHLYFLNNEMSNYVIMNVRFAIGSDYDYLLQLWNNIPNFFEMSIRFHSKNLPSKSIWSKLTNKYGRPTVNNAYRIVEYYIFDFITSYIKEHHDELILENHFYISEISKHTQNFVDSKLFKIINANFEIK